MKRRDRLLLLLVPAGMLAAAIIAVIVIGGGGGGGGKRVAPSRVDKMLAGIPQHGRVLGSPSAPVTLVEFADFQCPFCGEWERGTLPTIVQRYVRPGKVKIEFRGLHILDRFGPDSQRGLRAAYAAGQQDKLWYMVENLYERQRQEGSGWLSDNLVKQIANQIPGLDVPRMLSDRNSTTVDQNIRENDQLASAIRIAGTPTFYAGPSNGKLSQIALRTLAASGIEPTLDKLLAG